MTIKGLYKLIKERAPAAVETKQLSDLSGELVFIDASQLVYQWISAGITAKIVNGAGDHINHLQGCIWRVARLLDAGIRPVFVFDGAPPEMKNNVIEQRRTARANGTATKIPPGAFSAVVQLLSIMGIPAIAATGEAEATAAYLARIHGGIVYTDDSDCLLFGAPRMMRGKDEITIVSLDRVCTELAITRAELIDLGIILGCDYADKPAGVGPVRGMKIIKEYRSIDAAVLKGAFIPPARFDYIAARAIFGEIPLIDDMPPLGRVPANIPALERFLTDHGLNPARFASAIRVLEN
jgi:flap endonuclease-1